MKITENLKQQICELYTQKISISKISEMLNISNYYISKILKDNNIVVSKNGYSNINRFPKEKELEIIKLYKNGMNQTELGIKYNTWNTSIRRVLLRYNIIPRNESKILRYCKHNPFKSYKKHDEYTEYFLGLLLTDGCISYRTNNSRNPTINLSLNSEDGYIIKNFRDWASPNQKISKVYQKLNNSYMHSLSITNLEVVEWLNRKGNFKNKSFNCKIYCPITWQILRGIFDGDGGFHRTNKEGLNFFICGLSKDFIEQINNFLLKNNIKSKIRYTSPDKWHKHGLYYVEVHNYADVIKIGLNMYSNAHIFIKRKYERWLTFYENKRDKHALNSGKERHSNPEQNLPTL